MTSLGALFNRRGYAGAGRISTECEENCPRSLHPERSYSLASAEPIPTTSTTRSMT